MSAACPILEINDLDIAFPCGDHAVPVVRKLSLTLQPGERAALAGESGCGKSMTCLAIARLPPTDRARLSGSIRFEGLSILDDPAALARVRGHKIAYVFQDPAASLNPVMRIEAQLIEAMHPTPGGWLARLGGTRRAAREWARSLLARVRLPDPAALLRAFPCELSGGMQQRVMLAMALASEPRLLIADEPTTALDVTTQADVLDLIDELVRETGLSLLLVTHNLGLVAGRCDTLHVLYAGQIVESGPVAEVLSHPAHPYALGLLRAVPKLSATSRNTLYDIPGTVPQPGQLPPGCTFAPRCPYRDAGCEAPPETRPIGPNRSCRCIHPQQAAPRPAQPEDRP